MNCLYIVGAGGHGSVVAEAATLTGKWSKIAFLDDRIEKGGSVLDWRVIGCLQSVDQYMGPNAEFISAVGDNHSRVEITNDILDRGGQIASVFHPTATISGSAEISSGTVVFANAVVNTRSKVGVACIVNTAATVDHDCRIASGVHLSPGANLAGGVTVLERAWIGIGATVTQGITIGSDAVVGASAAVVSDVEPGSTVVGVPAKSVALRRE